MVACDGGRYCGRTGRRRRLGGVRVEVPGVKKDAVLGYGFVVGGGADLGAWVVHRGLGGICYAGDGRTSSYGRRHRGDCSCNISRQSSLET